MVPASSSFHVSDAARFDALAGLGSLDCIVQDPPAGIAFMGAQFDRDHGGRDAWIKLHAGLFAAGRRACKPGAWSLTWALPRTSHWTACALDDAGWEITDCVTHIHGQGWPKNARTQLKPASEHWYLARNGGGGSLQIDASRVARGIAQISKEGEVFTAPGGSWPTNLLLSHCEECEEQGTREVKSGARPNCAGKDYGHGDALTAGEMSAARYAPLPVNANGLETVAAFDCLAACSCGLATLAPSGGKAPRCGCGEAMAWACPVAELDGQSGTSKSADRSRVNRAANKIYGESSDEWTTGGHADSGGASRFFPTFSYAAKAATSERHAGAEHLCWWRDPSMPLGWRAQDREDYDACKPEARAAGNIHPTVKSLKLARWLVRLLCPPGGKGGDPFCGSGSIGIAAMLEGFDWISSDLSPEAIEIARARLLHWEGVKARDAARPAQGGLFDALAG